MILEGLERYGFEWDGDVIYQSASLDEHMAAIRALLDGGHAYHCSCSRKDLIDAPRGPLGAIYPGTCRAGCDAKEFAIRVRTDDAPISFIDTLQGRQTQRLESESGDFVIHRRDGLVAYQLAVVVDDALEGITEIVRGIDIMDSTQRQIWLQRLLGYATPDYAHIPVITHADGDKLSKLTGAPGIPFDRIEATLVAALEALQQNPPTGLTTATLADIWAWSLENWKLDCLQGLGSVPVDSIGASSLTETPPMQ